MIKKWQSETRVKSITSTTPAVRTVTLVCWWDALENESRHEIIPVVAIETRLEWHYEIEMVNGHAWNAPATHEELLAAGWRFTGEYVVHDVIIQDVGSSYLSSLESFDDDATVRSVQVCPWPESKDEIRLADTIATWKNMARQKYELCQKARAAKETAQ